MKVPYLTSLRKCFWKLINPLEFHTDETITSRAHPNPQSLHHFAAPWKIGWNHKMIKTFFTYTALSCCKKFPWLFFLYSCYFSTGCGQMCKFSLVSFHSRQSWFGSKNNSGTTHKSTSSGKGGGGEQAKAKLKRWRAKSKSIFFATQLVEETQKAEKLCLIN